MSGLAPRPVSASPTSSIGFKVSYAVKRTIGLANDYIAFLILKDDVKVGTPVPALQRSAPVEYLVSCPPLVVAYQNKATGKTQTNTMGALSFTKLTSGNRVYFKGAATDNNVRKSVEVGADPEAYSPFGTVNIRGFLCYVALSKLINGAKATRDECNG